MTTPNRILDWRKRLDWTQPEAAKQLGISPKKLWLMERCSDEELEAKYRTELLAAGYLWERHREAEEAAHRQRLDWQPL